ncbi:MAG: CehA/McbA family metallohydrolase [Gemmatimonadales bacterium]
MHRIRHRSTQASLAALGIACAISGTGREARAQLPRYGLSTRVELHMLPAVSTGPLDPAWSPDCKWIAFSMRGDIWKVPASGGEAIALTEGPGYHFEPAWSPDGARLALSVDIDGNLDIALVSADGGQVSLLTHDAGVDVQPVWSPDGKTVYFASARSADFDIYRIDVASGELTPVVSGRGHQFEPAVSPDGSRIVYVSPVRHRLGSGGLWVKPLDGGEPVMVHYEETSYRPAPKWTPDGTALVYASDAAGSYDIATVPAVGGNRVRLTDQPLDEFAPAVSPDGSTIAFVSNRGGATQLFTMSASGGAGGAWTAVPITARRSRVATGRLRGEVVGPDGAITPARIQLLASDGRGYAPDGGFHRVSPANEIHYFHTRGTFDVEIPAGTVSVEALRGFEFQPVHANVTVPAGGVATARLVLRRIADPVARGWYSGDTHVHDLHEGRFGLTEEEFYYQLVADDIHVTNDLIHMDGTKLMGRWRDLTGRNYELSDSSHILRYAEEFRGSYGHVALLGIERFVMPLIGGTPWSPYAPDVLKVRYLDEALAQGGLGGFVHPYLGNVDDVASAAQSDVPVHVALGRGGFFDVVSVASDELASAAMYYRMLNSGFRLSATGGTDNFSNVWRDPSGGTARTYAKVSGEFSYESWLAAVKAGRTFATNGPLVFARVNGLEPGSELRLDRNDPAALDVTVEVVSIAPFDSLEVLVNGKAVHSAAPSGDRTSLTLSTAVRVPRSGWVAVRVLGGKQRYVGDNYVFAQTTPVYVVRDGVTFTSPDDAKFLLGVVEELWRRVQVRDSWRTTSEKEMYHEWIQRATAVYRQIAERR